MSGKLDQSLDTIMADSGKGNTAGRGGRRRGPPRNAAIKAKVPTAPTGGIQKNNRAPRGAPTAPAVGGPIGDSKIIVGNLPEDINETLLKDFFQKAVGNVKKVLLSYGPNGRSRGEASIIFNKSTKAAEAFKSYNGVKVDGRPMRIEIVGATIATAQPAKTLADRMAKPKNAIKDTVKGAVAKKDGPKRATEGGARGGRAEKKKAGRAGRAKPKTAEELDAEMNDYFKVEGPATNGSGDATINGAAPAATNGGNMETDEVL